MWSFIMSYTLQRCASKWAIYLNRIIVTMIYFLCYLWSYCHLRAFESKWHQHTRTEFFWKWIISYKVLHHHVNRKYVLRNDQYIRMELYWKWFISYAMIDHHADWKYGLRSDQCIGIELYWKWFVDSAILDYYVKCKVLLQSD